MSGQFAWPAMARRVGQRAAWRERLQSALASTSSPRAIMGWPHLAGRLIHRQLGALSLWFKPLERLVGAVKLSRLGHHVHPAVARRLA